MAEYLLEIDGDEVEVLKDSLDLDLQTNWTSTLACQIPSVDPISRVGLRSDIVLKRDGTPIFGGIVSQAPEEGWGGPNLDQIVQHISAVSYSTYFTYRHVTATFLAGTDLIDVVTALAAYLPADITLDPGQVTGPALTVDLIFNKTRLDNALLQVTSDTGYFAKITPAKLFSMASPASTPVPFNLTGSGNLNQVGDVRVERTLDDNYANRVFVAVQGAGPMVVTEYFTADGSPAPVYTTKYPASDQITDAWPNELIIDDNAFGPVGWGPGYTTFWDYANHQFGFDGTGVVPTAGQVVTVRYAVAYPFFVEGNDLADQALHPIKEDYETVNEAMTIEAAQAYADTRATARAAGIERVLYVTEESGLLPGMLQTITIPERGSDAECLITEVKLTVPAERPGSEPIYSITAIVGTVEQGNTRQVYKRWLDGATLGNSVNSLSRSGAGTFPGGPVRAVQYHDTDGAFGGKDTFKFFKDENSLVVGELSSIDAASFQSCQVFGYDNHIADP